MHARWIGAEGDAAAARRALRRGSDCPSAPHAAEAGRAVMSTAGTADIDKCRHIYYGDCLDVMDMLPRGKFDMVFADPPYNLSGTRLSLVGNKTGGDYHKMNEKWDAMPADDYDRFTDRWIRGARDLLTESGSAYVCCTFHNVAAVMTSLRGAGMRINNVITWHKTNPMPSITKRTFTHSSEFVVYAVRGPKWVYNYAELKSTNPDRQKNGDRRQMRDVWSIPISQGAERISRADGRAAHPTQKPEELVRRAIVASSNPGDLVLDPFMGSGTTAVVADDLGRRWIGIENNPEYRMLALDRIRRNAARAG